MTSAVAQVFNSEIFIETPFSHSATSRILKTEVTVKTDAWPGNHSIDGNRNTLECNLKLLVAWLTYISVRIRLSKAGQGARVKFETGTGRPPRLPVIFLNAFRSEERRVG